MMPGTKHLHFFLKIHVCFLWTKWYVLLDAIQTQISIKRKAKASTSLSCPVALPMWLLGPEDQEASKGLLQLEPYQELLCCSWIAWTHQNLSLEGSHFSTLTVLGTSA